MEFSAELPQDMAGLIGYLEEAAAKTA
jgi:hypothetical protein